MGEGGEGRASECGRGQAEVGEKMRLKCDGLSGKRVSGREEMMVEQKGLREKKEGLCFIPSVPKLDCNSPWAKIIKFLLRLLEINIMVGFRG